MRIATRVAVFLASLMTWAGCGLNTMGTGDDDEDSLLDVVPDEALPDISEAIDNEVAEGDGAEEGPDDALDESRPDEVEPDESTDAFDAEEADDALEAEDEGSEEDGETVDPCALPEIPATGVYLFYCPEGIAPIDMVLGRYVEREGAPNIEWGYDADCRTPGAYFLWCNISSYTGWSPATVHFNFSMAGGSLWALIADPPGTPTSPYGLPRLWQNGVELTLGYAPNPGGGYNYTVRF